MVEGRPVTDVVLATEFDAFERRMRGGFDEDLTRVKEAVNRRLRGGDFLAALLAADRVGASVMNGDADSAVTEKALTAMISEQVSLSELRQSPPTHVSALAMSMHRSKEWLLNRFVADSDTAEQVSDSQLADLLELCHEGSVSDPPWVSARNKMFEKWRCGNWLERRRHSEVERHRCATRRGHQGLNVSREDMMFDKLCELDHRKIVAVVGVAHLPPIEEKFWFL